MNADNYCSACNWILQTSCSFINWNAHLTTPEISLHFLAAGMYHTIISKTGLINAAPGMPFYWESLSKVMGQSCPGHYITDETAAPETELNASLCVTLAFTLLRAARYMTKCLEWLDCLMIKWCTIYERSEHKFRFLENFVTQCLILHTIETVALPVCPGADIPKPDSCSGRLFGPRSWASTLLHFWRTSCNGRLYNTFFLMFSCWQIQWNISKTHSTVYLKETASLTTLNRRYAVKYIFEQ